MEEPAFGPEYEDVSTVRHNLAVLYKYTGKFDEAERLYRRALPIIERIFGPDHTEVATIYHNLGGLEHARSRFDDAEPLGKKAWVIRGAILGQDHPDTVADAAAWAGAGGRSG